MKDGEREGGFVGRFVMGNEEAKSGNETAERIKVMRVDKEEKRNGE